MQNYIFKSLIFCRTVSNAKDRLYNCVLSSLKDGGVGFTPIQVESTGHIIVKTLTNALWYIDPHIEKFQSRGIKVLPTMFQNCRGFNDWKAHKKKGTSGMLLIYRSMYIHDYIFLWPIRILGGRVLQVTGQLFKYHSTIDHQTLANYLLVRYEFESRFEIYKKRFTLLYVIRFVRCFPKVGGFLRALWFPLPIKLTTLYNPGVLKEWLPTNQPMAHQTFRYEIGRFGTVKHLTCLTSLFCLNFCTK